MVAAIDRSAELSHSVWMGCSRPRSVLDVRADHRIDVHSELLLVSPQNVLPRLWSY